MKDLLETFIVENREAFDDAVPDKSIWYRLDTELERKNQKNLILIWSKRIAASFVLVLVCGILIGILIGQSNHSKLDYSVSPELEKFKDTEVYYDQLVTLKLGEVQDSQTRLTVQSDLNQLDIIYKELREEMIHSNYSNSELLINAMIKNQKTKVEILESILQKQNNKIKQDETISI